MYGVITTVPAPVEIYDAVHAELKRRVDMTAMAGLHLHLAWATSDGFQTVNVWESKDDYDRARTELLLPVQAELAGDQPLPPIEQVDEEFEVRGLVVPASGIVV